jgi:RNA polymerase sigma factor (sigma-70 family)
MTSSFEAKEEFAQQLVSLQPGLLWYIASRVDDVAAQDDLLGRVNERALRRFEDGDIQRVEQFVFGIARHVMHEHWRELKRRRTTEAPLTDTAANYAVPRDPTTITGIKSRAWLLRALHGCLEQLPPADQHVARASYGPGKSKDHRAALASELGISRNTLDARISRIRARLEQCVEAKLSERFKADEARRKQTTARRIR